jgi:hypothetical protein
MSEAALRSRHNFEAAQYVATITALYKAIQKAPTKRAKIVMHNA